MVLIANLKTSLIYEYRYFIVVNLVTTLSSTEDEFPRGKSSEFRIIN